MEQSDTFCKNHPTRPTSLHCNRCGLPICTQCAVLTPVGYRCKECVREQQKIYETAIWYDFMIAAVLAGVCVGVGSILAGLIGFFVILVAPIVGSLAARAIQAAIRHRRSRYLWLTAAIGGLIGCLPLIFFYGLTLILSGLSGNSTVLPGLLLSLIWPGVYVVLAIGVLSAELRGIRFW